MRRVLITVGPTLALLLLLELAKRAGGLPVFVPGPSEVLMKAWHSPALLFGSLLPTAQTAATGYAIAAVVTLAAAAIGTGLQRLRNPFYFTGVTLNAIPVIATAPLLALWLGTGPRMHITIVALASQFPMLVGAMQGLQAADGRQIEMLHILSASRWQMFRYLLLPASLPYLFAGFKVAAPLAVLGAVTAEWAGADRGIGAMMLNALFSYDTVTVWLAVIACCALATAAYGVWCLIEFLLVRWDRPVNLPS
jgi:ABC-type nitrate/sulfonate/bicarbonate transport system permease component